MHAADTGGDPVTLARIQAMLPARAVRHMSMVDAYRRRLEGLQGVWDTLSLLSHMGGDGTDLSRTRSAFEGLATELVNQLSEETCRKSLRQLSAKAQVAIDVLVRNLFERTADIGFICADDDIRAYFEKSARTSDDDRAMCLRLREYAQKYSVYDNVLLVAPDGEILVELQQQRHRERSDDPLIAETLATSAGYVETYRSSDLLSGKRAGLIYSYRVMSGRSAVGVLCLCFDFSSEVDSIFSKLRGADDWTVLTWLDHAGRVIASSDLLQLPEGTVVPLALETGGKLVRLAGREYLAITRPTTGYQGYLGPAWYGHAMVPLEHAFESSEDDRRIDDPVVLAALAGSTEVFTEELSKVPERANAIQRELNRSVWNGNVRLLANERDDNTFAKVLLKEVSATGEKTRDVFARSIADLHQTVLSSILEDSRFFASLAVEIMDRNLYERANDCRWWALNGTLRNFLEGQATAEQATSTLAEINRLYTVYDNLFVFDRDCRVVALSNPKADALLGAVLSQPWARNTLSLANSQAYGVSAFEPCEIYGNRHTFVFTAAIRCRQGRVLGGIGIVFDSEPQFHAVLQDVVPRSSGDAAPRCIAVLADARGRVISATERFRPGEELNLPPNFLSPPPEGVAQVHAIDGHYFAVGACRTRGYREFNGVTATALIMESIGPVAEERPSSAQLHVRPVSTPARGREALEMATFYCAGHWFAVPAADVVEALDDVQVTRMPGSNAGCSGVIRFRDKIVPLLNLEECIGSGTAGKLATIIVVTVPGHSMIGLQVEALGDVVEAPVDRIVALTDTLGIGGIGLAARLVKPEAANGTLFLLLDPESLAQMMRAPQADRLSA
jgi:chemotaxis signal transduction protein